MKKSGLITNNVPKLLEALTTLTKEDVLVGVPASKTEREGGGPTNSQLAYIHDNGAPEANIPARPFMRPGIADAKEKIIAAMRRGAVGVLQGDAGKAAKALDSAGFAAMRAIKARINDGPPPPLQLSTIRARARRGKRGAREYLAFMDWPNDMRQAALAAGLGIAKPLVENGELRNSISYVVRGRDYGQGGEK